MAKKKQNFELPESILNQLNEFTTGFALVILDQTGNPVTYSHFDNSISEMGTYLFAASYFNAMVQNEANMIQGSFSDEEDDGGCDCPECRGE